MFGLVPFDRKRNQLQRGDSGAFDIDRIFESFFNDSVFPTFYNRSGLMQVDIRDEGESFVLEADLPGIKKDQIEVNLEDDQLTINVNYDENDEEKNENYIRRERRCCSMTRSFNVSNINADKIKASMEDGVLQLVLPKAEPEKQNRRKIDIK